KEGTVFPGNFDFKNNNLLASINHRSLDNKLQLHTSINYGYRKSNLFNVASFVNNGIRLAPNAPSLFDEAGNVNWELDEHGNPTFTNPMAGLANPNTNRMKTLQWNGNITYKLVEGLYLKLNMGFNNLEQSDKQISYIKNFNPVFPASVRRNTNNMQLYSVSNVVVEPHVHYSNTFKKHDISSLIGYTFQNNGSENVVLRGQGYFSDSQVGNIGLAEEKNILRNERVEYRYAALFGRIGYSFND